MKLSDEQLRCKPTCEECGGNGSIGGDTESMWCCTRWTSRIMRHNRLGPYAQAWADGPEETAYRKKLESDYGPVSEL